MADNNSQYPLHSETLGLTRDSSRLRRRRPITMAALQEAISGVDSCSLPPRSPRDKAVVERVLSHVRTAPSVRHPADIEVSTHCMWAVGGSIVATVVVDKLTGMIVDWSSQFVAHGPTTSVASAA